VPANSDLGVGTLAPNVHLFEVILANGLFNEKAGEVMRFVATYMIKVSIIITNNKKRTLLIKLLLDVTYYRNIFNKNSNKYKIERYYTLMV